jgi:NIPSNAP
MVYELRVYTLQPGKVPEFQALIEQAALPFISKYSKLVGWWSTEVGPLNEVVHIWAYEDLNHRARARQAQAEDPQLQAFRPKAQAMVVSQYNKILTPASFSPLQ